ncbi:unnamed protein product [Ambrosiozyma monospora]|uniref:Unnamed protein product n=1 Tax=Ambrosiozyma monospora TaxID=43982 RepID=A0ACB5TVI5_AMBMO|nr:unnamed protein product [Ambrosiozyma monospora]
MKATLFTSLFSLATAPIASAAAVFYNVNSTDNLYELALDGAYAWTDPQFATIQSTCNATNVRMINAGLQDSIEAASFARQRLLEKGSNDDVYKKWFGDGSIYEVLGLISYLVEAEKSDISYRCDDVDGSCASHPTSWPGYDRESNDSETVICDLFYTSKKPLSTLCFDGTLVETGPKHYAGIDLLHRYLHTSKMSSDHYIAEYAEELPEILDYAQNNASFATRNVDSYLYYIAESYADAVIPGGCLGDVNNPPKSDD